ncbi:MAG: hypothetical protein JW951_07975, partial [Lentisphaerae bacterium]|nr:hypothetical protein [Lentisphaerota bacterium]
PENAARWEREARPYGNVTVTRAGSVNEWIAAADAVVHFNCTTGVEAFLQETPAVAYRPSPSETYEAALPKGVSLQAFCRDETVSLLERIVGGREDVPGDRTRAEWRALARDYITALDGPLAGDRIVEALRAAPGPRSRRRSAAERLGLWKREAWPSVARRFERPPAGEARFEAAKFPGLAAEEVNACAAELRAVSGRFERVRIDLWKHGCFRIVQE